MEWMKNEHLNVRHSDSEGRNHELRIRIRILWHEFPFRSGPTPRRFVCFVAGFPRTRITMGMGKCRNVRSKSRLPPRRFTTDLSWCRGLNVNVKGMFCEIPHVLHYWPSLGLVNATVVVWIVEGACAVYMYKGKWGWRIWEWREISARRKRRMMKEREKHAIWVWWGLSALGSRRVHYSLVGNLELELNLSSGRAELSLSLIFLRRG